MDTTTIVSLLRARASVLQKEDDTVCDPWALDRRAADELEVLLQLREEIIKLGRECAVGITGDPEDGAELKTTTAALAAIRESLRLGNESHQERNRLDNEREQICKALGLSPDSQENLLEV